MAVCDWFQDAARCRDELKVLTPPPKAAPGLAAVMTKSEVITKVRLGGMRRGVDRWQEGMGRSRIEEMS